MTSYKYQPASYAPQVADNNSPKPPPRNDLNASHQEDKLLPRPSVPPRMDKSDHNADHSTHQGVCSCNYNRYATKKTIGHGLLGFALITSNAMQLRTLITQKQRDSIWIASLLLVCASITIQVILAYILIIVGKGNIENPEKQSKLEKYNNIALFLTTLVSMINVVINVFMSTTDTSSYLDTRSLDLLKTNT